MQDNAKFLENVNKVFFDQIKSADQKAAYVLTVALALTITSEVAKEAFKFSSYATRSTISAHAGIAHAALIIFTLIFALLVIFPRFRTGGTALYWGAWPEAGTRISAATSETEFSEAREYIESNKQLALICKSKFRNLRVSFILLIASSITHSILLSLA